jgi:hypothetical protein
MVEVVDHQVDPGVLSEGEAHVALQGVLPRKKTLGGDPGGFT